MRKDFERRPRKPDLSTMVYGKIPPQAPEMEELVLGAIMQEPDKIDDVLDIVPSEECFYQDPCQKIYKAIIELHRGGSKVDFALVTEQLRKNGELESIGGAYYVTSLIMKVVTSAHVETHARLIMEKFISREVIRISGHAISDAYEDSGDCFELLDKTVGELNNIFDGQADTTCHISQAIKETLGTIELARLNPGKLLGVDTGFVSLNNVLNGWLRQNLIIIGARPAQGKTALALNIAISSARSGKPTLFFSLEMSKSELSVRMISIVSGVEMDKIQKGTTNIDEQDRINRAASEIAALPIFLDDRAGLTWSQIRSKVRRLKRKKGLQMVIGDYLQLIKTSDAKNKNREQQVSEVSRELKGIAKDYDLPFIALAQLGRDADNKRPTLANLRESGAIEQDGDSVIFIYHDESEGQTKSYLIVAKNRHGKTDDVQVKFYGALQKWTDIQDNRFEQFEVFRPNAGIVKPAAWHDEF
jgi:replicative DNA helicase